MPPSVGRAMNFRLWYPQLDVYDGIRRCVCLLEYWKGPAPSLERLFIYDFFFANPPLLHRTQMTRHIRDEFNQLGIPRPESTFLSYPSAPILFHGMAPIQKQAIQTLTGKGLLERDDLRRGKAVLSNGGKQFGANISGLLTADESPVLEFLVSSFAKIGREDIAVLRRSTGLRRVAQ